MKFYIQSEYVVRGGEDDGALATTAAEVSFGRFLSILFGEEVQTNPDDITIKLENGLVGFYQGDAPYRHMQVTANAVSEDEKKVLDAIDALLVASQATDLLDEMIE